MCSTPYAWDCFWGSEAVARRSGVSQAAPYAHFDGRQALLASVGTRGFLRLTHYLSEAGQVGDDAATDMGMLARAYLAFALDCPMLLRLMFGSELCAIDDAALEAAGQASYAPIRAAVSARVAAEGANMSEEDAGLAAWALVHGLATLIVDGKQPWPENAEARGALVDRVVSIYSLTPGPERRLILYSVSAGLVLGREIGARPR